MKKDGRVFYKKMIKVYFPRFFKIRQHFYSDKIEDVFSAVKEAVLKLNLRDKVSPGKRIAITVGSRGISNIVDILRVIVETVKQFGGDPFLVAAMGSHGGGTGDGMLKVLAGLGITAERVGAPIASTNRVVELGATRSGLKVYCAAEAVEADGIIVVNRVKPHTAFRGEHESGLIKMLSVGLGRAPGAEMVHRAGPLKMREAVPEIAEIIISKAPVLGGVAVVENVSEETAIIEGFPAGQMVEGDKKMLLKAREFLPRLPVDELDFLVVREMGKNFSGTGMDTNVIGRWCLEEVPDPEKPSIKRIAVLDLSAASHGNANGIGIADFTTRRLLDKIDFNATYLNGLTTNFLRRIMLPVILPTDRDVFEKGIASLRLQGREPRILIIKNTLHLSEMYASQPLIKELAENRNVVIGEPVTLEFDSKGNLVLY